MSIPVISFIVPAYNAGRYISDCLDSIFRLDLGGESREVIVVNDGSADDTANILALYKTKRPDMIILTQDNKGLSCARNAGLHAATGRYIVFVDADDTLLDTAIPMELLSKDIDIIGINVLRKHSQGGLSAYRRYPYKYNKLYSPAREFMIGRNLMPCVVAYLYRADFLRAADVLFTPHILCEDEDFTPRAFAAAETFMAADIDLYLYTEREGSITTTTDHNRLQWKLRDLVSTLRRLDGLASSNKDLQRCFHYKLDYLTVDILRLLLRERHSMPFRREVLSALRSIGRFPLHWHWEPKHIAFNLLTRFIFRNCK